ncbi:prepilin peptidase-dependent protein [Musicola paradisiaca]|uniref:Prepilin peptidase dependent protein B n=1 Tax=Musicola paradisiaca (strain Ech703) TaxID=579405 RepID=C6CC27_MUSP7|nr:prepilin peptidase-dependent protein [Musicola paradisiaca]ACS86787.1 conserved hypothetical protein [Musicola paradisiaca Ech703]
MLNVMKQQRGFTLPEVMLAMGFGSLITLAAAGVLPVLHARVQSSASYFRLEQALSQALFTIEKDVRRAGFCAGACGGLPVTLNTGEDGQALCFSLAYDINANGQWEQGERGDAEHYGYRLRNGALEVQTGGAGCQGSRWEKLLDPAEIKLTRFVVRRQAGEHQRLYFLTLEGHWTSHPAISLNVTRWVAGRNDAG